MLHKTRGIFLKATSFSESSLVVLIYTEKFGCQTYLLQGVKKNKSKIRTSILQPLFLYDLVVYHKENGGLQRISECRNNPVFHSIPSEMHKTAIAIFICELLNHTLREPQEDPTLFEFLFQSIQFLDLTEGATANFHLWFMLHYTKFLGFFPNEVNRDSGSIFDLKLSEFVSNQPIHPHFVNKEGTVVVKKILQCSISDLAELGINNSLRRELIARMMDYYHLHITGFQSLKSHHVLMEVMKE